MKITHFPDVVAHAWLVWQLDDGGGRWLRAVCTTPEAARLRVETVQREPRTVRAAAEHTLLNHLFGASMFQAGRK